MVPSLHLNPTLYLMVKVKVERTYNGWTAFFKDSKGYKTIFSPRNSLSKLKDSIHEYMEKTNINHYQIESKCRSWGEMVIK